MKDQTLNAANKVRYQGLIIEDDLCDDDDGQQCQTCKNCAKTHMLVDRFHLKIALIKAH